MDAREPEDLLLMAIASLRDGRLPTGKPELICGGNGSGSCCALCSKTLAAHEPEVEIEVVTPGADAPRSSLRFHVGCFAAWQVALGL